MTEHSLKGIDEWVSFLGSNEMPILRQTARKLEQARQNMDTISGRDIAGIVLQDPLMAVRVLAYIQPFTGKHLRSEITTIANAVMMLGIEPFFRKFETPATIESALKDEPQALLGVLQVIRRVQRASRYAHDWAFERHDLNIEEVTLAALLHDLGEVLLWCFAPKLASEIRERLQKDKTLRSHIAQQEVLGFPLIDLQKALCTAWHLPELLNALMDDANAHLPRVQNVTLAVNLARHSTDDWNNTALPDDFASIERLLHIDRHTLLNRLGIPGDAIQRFMLAQETDDSSKPTA